MTDRYKTTVTPVFSYDPERSVEPPRTFGEEPKWTMVTMTVVPAVEGRSLVVANVVTVWHRAEP